MQIRVFQCPVCGSRVVCPKYKGRTGKGHVKHTYCVRCRAVTAHVQIE